MREVEAEITELKKTDYNVMTRPVCAFITFAEEDGYIVAQKFEMVKTWTGKVFPAKGQLLGCDLFLREATEPLNVLWENRHFTPM